MDPPRKLTADLSGPKSVCQLLMETLEKMVHTPSDQEFYTLWQEDIMTPCSKDFDCRTTVGTALGILLETRIAGDKK